MESLLNGFRHFRKEVYPRQRGLFRQLAGGQTPHTLFITCADSRVMPELMFAAQPGELFVYRNIGNVVPPYSQHVSGVVAAIEYAVAVLQVKHIVVCGHTDCGAMKAVLNPDSLQDVPNVAAWLKHTDSARQVAAQHDHAGHPEDALHCLTEENVVSQLDHLRTQPVVAARLARGALRIHGWIYDIAHGEIRAFDAEQGRFVPLLPEEGKRAPEATPRPRLVPVLRNVAV
ncbi:carbonic anhydrase [Xanthomonas sp. GW]|uniref:carbonic anhydrase n=1 Tax=Xanthomonas sp. GW TaxID=2724121 RepID=UPI00163A51F5|nr:carbonic anhydrase [Xanthomonas sp. GW]QNH20721.1 carbonic anhydrase [Xanthomonas sp. GW]